MAAGEAGARAGDLALRAAYEQPWRPDFAAEIHAMRHRLDDTAPAGNVKRGPGGIVDIEFTVQMLQLAEGAKHPQVRVPGTLAALAALRDVGALSRDDAEFLAASYRYLRSLECGLRLMNSTARDDLPQDPVEQAKLAKRQGAANAQALLEDCARYMSGNRTRFERIFAVSGK